MKLPRTFVPFLFFLSLITAKKIINCNVLIIYHSVTNHTKKLAHAIGNGVTNHNVNINVKILAKSLYSFESRNCHGIKN